MKKLFVRTAIFLFALFVLVLTLRGVGGNPTATQIMQMRAEAKPFESSQSSGRYALIVSIVDNHTLFFTKDIAAYAAPDLGFINGHYVSLFAPGVSYLALPFYIVGKYFNLAQLFTFGVSVFFALVNFIFIYLIVVKITKNRIAGLISGLVFLFSTTAWSYAIMLNQHHITTALILMSLYLLMLPTKWFTSLLFGLLLSTSFFIEYPNVAFFIPLAILLIIRHISISDSENKIKLILKMSIFIGIIGIVIGLLPNLWYNKNAHGSYFTLSSVVQRITDVKQNELNLTGNKKTLVKDKTVEGLFSTAFLPKSMDVLVTSMDRGIIFYAPIMILALLGLYPLYKKDIALFCAIAGGITIIFLLYGMWPDPWGGWAFGPRYLIPAMGQMAILLGVAINEYAKKIWFVLLFIPIFLYSTFVNLAGALTTNLIPPSSERDSAKLLPKLTYLHNFDLVRKGESGSYVYNTYLSSHISLMNFAIILFAVISCVVLALYFFAYKNVKTK